MAYYLDENELKHFGIKGQKWGVRRFENEDGTLTPEGKKRYSSSSSIGNGISVAKEKQHTLGRILGKISPRIREEQEKTNLSDILVDGKKVGEIQTYLEDKGSLNIVWLEINERERGKQYAQKAMDYIIKTSKDKGLKQITLEVPGNSPDARHIYEKKGFVPGEQITTPEEDPVWDGLTKMRKQL